MSALSKIHNSPAARALQEMWQQRSGESGPDYAAFQAWLGQPDRPLPPDPALAERNEWASRAMAYDSARAVLGPSTTTPEAHIVRSLTQMVRLEADKLLRQSAGTPQPTTQLKDLLATVNLLKSLQQDGAAETAKASLAGLSDDEKRAILKAQMILQKARK